MLPIWPKYADDIDRESACELLDARVAAAQNPTTETAPEETAPAGTGGNMPPRPGSKPARPAKKPSSRAKPAKEQDGAIAGYLKSREGRSMINRVTRGVFDLLKK